MRPVMISHVSPPQINDSNRKSNNLFTIILISLRFINSVFTLCIVTTYFLSYVPVSVLFTFFSCPTVDCVL